MMKKILIFMVSFSSLFAQEWDKKNPVVDEKTITSIFFIDNQNGWFGKIDGTIMKTTDGCKTFSVALTEYDASYEIKSVYFVDYFTGYAATSNGKVFKSIDGGNTWSEIFNNNNLTINSIYFIDENSGFFAANRGRIYKTENGGISWEMITSTDSPQDYYSKIFFSSQTNGFITGRINNLNLILRTTNSGKNWSFTTVVLEPAGIYIKDSIGIASADSSGKFLLSFDSGISWNEKNAPTSEKILAGYVDSDGICFSTKSEILKTTDYGENWTTETVAYPGHWVIQRAQIINTSNFICGGKDGVITYKYSEIWNLIEPFIFPRGRMIFISENIGWANPFVKTTDGGESWFKIIESNYPSYVTSNYYYATETTGYILRGRSVLKTTDGGLNWDSIYSFTSLESHTNYRDIYFFDSLRGIILKQPTDAGGLLLHNRINITTDGGFTWGQDVILGTAAYTRFYPIDDHLLLINGQQTTDQGDTWYYNEFSIGDGIFFIDSLYGWCIESEPPRIKVTNNRGLTFTYYSHLFFYTSENTRFFFEDSLLGFTSHSSGSRKTTDGGISWELTSPQFKKATFHKNRFNGDLFRVDPNGVIFKYIKSGPIPVQLTSFTASVQQNSVHLNWQTATETNNKGFELERKAHSAESPAHGMWETVTFIPGSGTITEPQQYSFIDENVASGSYKYRLKQIDFDGSFEYSKEIEINTFPTEFALYQNYPNPFNSATKIKYAVPSSLSFEERTGVRSFVTLKVFDILGNQITTLVNEVKEPGEYEVDFDGSRYSSGVYFYTLQAGEFTATKKFVLMK